jgi:glycosyltransferase involved in cell wall biosynthesis
MVGQKGLPATFGGVEHHVEQIGARLAERGHEVTVFCRSSYGEVPDGGYRGMRLVSAPTIGTKHLDAIVHSGTSTVAALRSGVDVVHYHALGPALAAPLPRYLSGAGVVLTVHGLDQDRAKWGLAARTVLGTAHRMSARVPDEVVVVSEALRQHYLDRFGRRVSYVPNGTPPPAAPVDGAAQRLARHGLERGRYALFVGRLVPEKRPDLLLEAFRDVPGDVRLAVVGDSSFTDGYAGELRRLAATDPRVVLTGYVYGDDLAALYQNAGVFVQPSALEGLPLTLLEAVAHDCDVVASDIPPHREVLGAGSPRHVVVPVDDRTALTAALASALGSGAAAGAGGARLRADVLSRYSWDVTIDRLEHLYRAATVSARRRRTRGRGPADAQPGGISDPSTTSSPHGHTTEIQEHA